MRCARRQQRIRVFCADRKYLSWLMSRSEAPPSSALRSSQSRKRRAPASPLKGIGTSKRLVWSCTRARRPRPVSGKAQCRQSSVSHRATAMSWSSWPNSTRTPARTNRWSTTKTRSTRIMVKPWWIHCSGMHKRSRSRTQVKSTSSCRCCSSLRTRISKTLINNRICIRRTAGTYWCPIARSMTRTCTWRWRTKIDSSSKSRKRSGTILGMPRVGHFWNECWGR